VVLVIALALGLGAGLANGFLIAYLGGSSFIITLAMGTVLVGLEYVFTDQKTIFSGVSQGYIDIGQNEFLGLNNQIWIAAGIALVLWALLDKSEIGRYMYAIGGNPEAARKEWEQGIEIAVDLQMPYEEGRLRLSLGQLSGDKAHLEKALGLFEATGAVSFSEAARAALRDI